MFGLGLRPEHLVATTLFVALTTLAFLALQQMFIILLGTAAGRVVSLVLLMLQLSSSGGTYPVETTPHFFSAIHPYMPATYVVDGLRALMGGGVDSRFWVALAFMTGLLVISLAVSAIATGRQKVWTIARLHPELHGVVLPSIGRSASQGGNHGSSPQHAMPSRQPRLRSAARHGISGSSMDEIAEEASVAKGSLYYHFPSKDAIFEQVLQGGFDRLADAIGAPAST